MRRAAGVTQEQLAQHLGLTFQQVQKYERGVNRVSVSMLYKIAEKLRVDPRFVYDGLPDPARGGAWPNPISAFWVARDALPLAQIFVRLERQRQVALLAVARALADDEDEPLTRRR